MRSSFRTTLVRARAARPKRLKLRGGTVALATLLVSALALTQSGGVQAQSPNNVANPPAPCGPGTVAAFMPEPHEITSGHFYLFDAYWEDTTDPESVDGRTGVLHTNTCPPALTTTTKTGPLGGVTTTTSLTESGLDVDEVIIHVLNVHQVDVVATNAEATNGQLSLEEYPEVRAALGIAKDAAVPEGTKVWWLQLDDPDTPDDNEQSSLSLGFSTIRFSDEYWLDESEENPAFSYRLDLERNPGIDPDEHPHLLAYEAPSADDGEQAEAVWDSARTSETDLDMTARDLKYLQWVFTKPGTYEISAHLVGKVRPARQLDDPRTWMRISANKTEASEVKRYTIQVGDELNEEEPPLFGLNLSVPENSAPGTVVSPPLPILAAEAPKLTYELSGEGSDDFALEITTNPHTVQIVVAEGANLDYETRPEYELRLSVTDKLDHESNPDPTIDDVLGIKIALEDEPGKVVIEVSKANPVAGDTVTFTAKVTEFGQGQTLIYEFESKNGSSDAPGRSTYEVQHNGSFTDVVRLTVLYHVDNDPSLETLSIEAEPVSVTWTAPDS